jgi:RNA polymerase sigma-70 factor, ECF subfamily
MAQARAGDRAAFGRVVGALQDRLYNAVYRLVGHPDDALDLTQEAFTKALENIATFRGDAAAYTWLFRIAYNAVLTRRRRDAVRIAVSLDAGNDSEPDDQMTSLRRQLRSDTPAPDEMALSRERQRHVADALQRLDVDDRGLLVMRDIDGMDYADIAVVLGVPLGTVKSRLFRSRLALRQEMEKLEGTADRKTAR